MAERLLSGTSTNQLIQEKKNLGFLMMHLQKIKTFEAKVHEISWQAMPLPALKVFDPLSERPEAIIAAWIKKNLIEGFPNSERPLREKQLYIHGDMRLGKSALAAILRKSFHTYVPPSTCSSGTAFLDEWDDSFELIIFDEFFGQFPISWMNTLLSGEVLRANTKGGTTIKRVNTPIMILSNIPPDHLYSGVPSNVREAWVSRMHVVHVTHFINIF